MPTVFPFGTINAEGRRCGGLRRTRGQDFIRLGMTRGVVRPPGAVITLCRTAALRMRDHGNDRGCAEQVVVDMNNSVTGTVAELLAVTGNRQLRKYLII